MEYLDFELPIKELEEQLEKCTVIGEESDVDVAETCKQIEKKIADILVKETFLGSSFMASISNKSPGELRIDVTSPGGVTEAALEEFNKNSIFKKTIEKAIKSAVKKSITLSN